MKRLIRIILVVAIAAFISFAIAYAVYDFVASDGIHYFSGRPQRLLSVAVIGILGGLIVFGYSKLPSRLRRSLKLTVLGLGASFVMLAGGYLSFQVFNMPARFDPSLPRHIPWLLVLGTAAIAGFLSFGFYETWHRRRW